jgi:hypothetical protein
MMAHVIYPTIYYPSNIIQYYLILSNIYPSIHTREHFQLFNFQLRMPCMCVNLEYFVSCATKYCLVHGYDEICHVPANIKIAWKINI